MKIYLDGQDNTGWHMDVERRNILHALRQLGITEVKSQLQADIVHNIWWNTCIPPNKNKISLFFLRLQKKLLVTASNFINIDDPSYALRKEFNQVNTIAHAWIAPSTKQQKILEAHNVLCFYQPFFLDMALFKPLRDSFKREHILDQYRIPKEIVNNKCIIGSFQRDSLGSDLTRPKWQKDPDFLIELVKDIPKDKFILLLAGPRRHYVIHKCKEYHIPYWYLGKETDEDDLTVNSLAIEALPALYALIDIYVVTSQSEGGPKTVMEATATKTYIVSTDVGLARDFLSPSNVFQSKEEYKKALYDFVADKNDRESRYKNTVIEQYKRCIDILNNDAMLKRLMNIYSEFLKLKRSV
ncbi:MAG: glycosyltransferase [Candidatus Omnitrophica bacterium]|nr:glycosyltransferase [Candidatus Omnitrophota bacterium]